VKRRDLIRRIAGEAKRQGISWTADEGGKHSTYLLGDHRIPIPRHTEIGEGLPKRSSRNEGELGKRWWK
jgi:hypothetical protein